MRIICPNCASHYEVDGDNIAAAGQLVRCAQCREVWLVKAGEIAERPAVPIVPAPSSDREPTRFKAPVLPGTSASRPIDFAAARTRLRRRAGVALPERQRTGATTVVAIGASCVALLGLLVGFRATVVDHLPLVAPAYAALGLPVNSAGLALRDVHSVVLADGDKTVLSLEGEIANLRDGPVSVPNLTVVVRDDAEVPLYSWTAAVPKARLGRGETVAFRSRLDAPPKDGRDVRVSFADAGTIATTSR